MKPYRLEVPLAGPYAQVYPLLTRLGLSSGKYNFNAYAGYCERSRGGDSDVISVTEATDAKPESAQETLITPSGLNLCSLTSPLSNFAGNGGRIERENERSRFHESCTCTAATKHRSLSMVVKSFPGDIAVCLISPNEIL